MKKFLSVMAFSLSALMASSAMAAPDHRNGPRFNKAPAPHMQGSQQHWNDKDRYDPRFNQQRDNRYFDSKRVNPSRDWRSGQTLPRSFNSSRYKISDREARRLPNTGRYQQWYKVNGDYVLVNERNDRIIRIIN